MEVFKADEILFDAPCTHESVEKTHTTRLVVRPTSSATAEWLLPHDSACAFVIVIDVPRGVSEAVRGPR